MKIIKAVLYLQVSAIILLNVFAGAKPLPKGVPFHGTLNGPEISDLPFPLFFVEGTGSGNATHLGHFTASWHRAGSLEDGGQTASYEYVAANGDSIFVESVGQADLSLFPDIHVLEIGTIIGGTGRFAGASGTLAIERVVMQTGLLTTVTSDTINGTLVLAKGK